MLRTQALVIGISALAGGRMFWVWRHIDEEGRSCLWKLYGWFTALMFCGSCAAFWSTLANMMFLYYLFPIYQGDLAGKPNDHLVINQSQIPILQRWLSASEVLNAVDFFFLSITKLMVLDRLKGFSAPKSHGQSSNWTMACRVLLSIVVVGNVVGLCGSIAAAVYLGQAAFDASHAVNASEVLYVESFSLVHRSSEAQSVQAISESAVLLLIVIAFAIVGAASARRIRNALVGMTAAGAPQQLAGRTLQRKIVVTVVFVFLSFVLRAIVMVLKALGGLGQQLDSITKCRNPCSMQCNAYTNLQFWLLFTPEYWYIAILISSPIALLVALWGMTSERTKSMIATSKRQQQNMSLLAPQQIS